MTDKSIDEYLKAISSKSSVKQKMLSENKIKVKPKTPMLNREASEDYTHHTTLWEINDNFIIRGGNPTIIDFVSVRNVPRYKVKFPNGDIDYFRVDLFDTYYEFECQ